MLKRDYYLHVMNADIYRQRDWVISAFSICADHPQLSDVYYPWAIISDPSNKDKLFVAVPEGDGYRSEMLEDSYVDRPLFAAIEELDIRKGELPLQHDDINTTYGIILGNMYLLHYPFGSKFKFINDVIGSGFQNYLAENLTDNVKDRSLEDPTKVYVREFLAFGEACDALDTYDHLFASSGSINTLTVHKDVIKLRDALIEQNKDRLHDVTVQAKIEEALVKADKESFKDDLAARNYLISGKAFNPTRKKQLIMIGGSSGFGTEGEASFVATSLRDGWKKEDIPVHANEARAGSFFRGKETQYGGADVKVANRMMMNARIEMEYCGATKGHPARITEQNKKMYVGLWAVKGNTPVLITSEMVNSFVGKTIMTHSPQYCKVGGSSYCAVCMGKIYSYLPNGVPSVVSNIYDTYMYDKMKRMHGKALIAVILNVLGIAY